MPKFLNNLLCSAMIFALSFLWTYYSLKSVFWAVISSSVISLCSAYLIYRAQTKAGERSAAKKRGKKAVENFYGYLKYNDNNAELLGELYRYYGYDVEICGYDSLIACKDGIKTFVAATYEKDKLSQENVVEAIRQAKRIKADKLRLFVNKTDAVICKNAAQAFDAEFVDINNAYALFAQADKLPNCPQIKQSKSAFAAKYAFCRKRFGWYFASSVFMALTSVIAYFPYYTLAWATVMLILALYSMFNTKYNEKQTTVKLN